MLTLCHSPYPRSTGARLLLEELGAPYELRLTNRKTGEQRQTQAARVAAERKVLELADMRYRGQAYNLTVALDPRPVTAATVTSFIAGTPLPPPRRPG